MVGKSQKKLIASLAQKKYRDKTGLFIGEGPKLVNDLISSGLLPEIVFTTCTDAIKTDSPLKNVEVIDDADLKKISQLKTPQKVLALFKKPDFKFEFENHANNLTLCLDGIQDPGNMGTILRLADWFGFKTIICSEDTVDVFNPKVVQASMGALARVNVHYTGLKDFCRQSVEKYNLPVFGTFMDGDNIYNTPLPDKGLIIMGNEGNGIRPEIEKEVTSRLTIPSFSKQSHIPGMESLNVGVATAIVCSEFYRRNT